MHFIKTMLKLKLLVLKKDRLTFFWSAFVPLLFVFLNMDNYKTESNLIPWFIYILIVGFTYGVGISALNNKDSGYLSLIFSIKNNPMGYFLSLLISQIIYTFISMLIVNVFASIFGKFNFITLTMYSLLCILICIPVAFVFYNITYLKGTFASTLNSFTSISIGILIFFSGKNKPLSFLNPFDFFNAQFTDIIKGNFPISIVVSIILVLISIPSIYKFCPISNERLTIKSQEVKQRKYKE